KPQRPDRPVAATGFVLGKPFMAAVRDQAARALRQEPDEADGDTANEAPRGLGESLRAQVAEETKRRPAEPNPAIGKPQAAPPAAALAKPVRRRFVLIGVVLLLALAAAGYGTYYVLVGRFFVSTDDAYVRANNTMMGARVTGHITAILPRDNALVHAG